MVVIVTATEAAAAAAAVAAAATAVVVGMTTARDVDGRHFDGDAHGAARVPPVTKPLEF